MIEVNINLVPFGFQDSKKEIATVTIWNKGPGSTNTSNYGYEIVDNRGLNIRGDFNEFQREDGVLKLLHGVLDKAFDDMI